MATVSKQYKLIVTDYDKERTITLNDPATDIDSAKLGGIQSAFKGVGYEIVKGYYYTVSKGDESKPSTT